MDLVTDDTSEKKKKELIRNLKGMSDEDLFSIIRAFDSCQVGACWKLDCEGCEFYPIRKRLGLGNCLVHQSNERMRKKEL